MQRLTRRVAHSCLHRMAGDDRGVSMVLVAVTMVALLGMAAFAIDVGAIYAERRELQVGAEAAVLAIAEDCGLGARPCDAATAAGTADAYADANASDDAAAIYEIDLDTAAQSIAVTTSTEQVGGSTILAPFFAQVIGYGGGTVGASAEAAWGALSGGSTLPIIISDCEWDRYEIGDSFIFYFHDGQAAEPCDAQPGHDDDGDGKLPGGFGWLDTGGDDCVAEVFGSVVGADPGASPSNGCSPAYFREQIYLQDVLVPWYRDFDGVGGAGGNGEYEISGIGAIHVTGYNFGGQYKAPSAATAPCKGDDRCIAGTIVQVTVTDGDIGGEDRGVLVVKLTG